MQNSPFHLSQTWTGSFNANKIENSFSFSNAHGALLYILVWLRNLIAYYIFGLFALLFFLCRFFSCSRCARMGRSTSYMWAARMCVFVDGGKRKLYRQKQNSQHANATTDMDTRSTAHTHTHTKHTLFFLFAILFVTRSFVRMEHTIFSWIMANAIDGNTTQRETCQEICGELKLVLLNLSDEKLCVEPVNQTINKMKNTKKGRRADGDRHTGWLR